LDKPEKTVDFKNRFEKRQNLFTEVFCAETVQVI
jgi:hypothetical protein